VFSLARHKFASPAPTQSALLSHSFARKSFEWLVART
jgi:hypothetical protein